MKSYQEPERKSRISCIHRPGLTINWKLQAQNAVSSISPWLKLVDCLKEASWFKSRLNLKSLWRDCVKFHVHVSRGWNSLPKPKSWIVIFVSGGYERCFVWMWMEGSYGWRHYHWRNCSLSQDIKMRMAL